MNNEDYCDYCGSKLLKDPIGSNLWANINSACYNCGYNCKTNY